MQSLPTCVCSSSEFTFLHCCSVQPSLNIHFKENTGVCVCVCVVAGLLTLKALHGPSVNVTLNIVECKMNHLMAALHFG